MSSSGCNGDPGSPPTGRPGGITGTAPPGAPTPRTNGSQARGRGGLHDHPSAQGQRPQHDQLGGPDPPDQQHPGRLGTEQPYGDRPAVPVRAHHQPGLAEAQLQRASHARAATVRPARGQRQRQAPASPPSCSPSSRADLTAEVGDDSAQRPVGDRQLPGRPAASRTVSSAGTVRRRPRRGPTQSDDGGAVTAPSSRDTSRRPASVRGSGQRAAGMWSAAARRPPPVSSPQDSRAAPRRRGGPVRRAPAARPAHPAAARSAARAGGSIAAGRPCRTAPASALVRPRPAAAPDRRARPGPARPAARR